MKKFSLFLLSIFLMGNAFSQCADTANIYTFNFGLNKYEIVKEMKTWDVAAACAVERGGHLVEINSLAEQNAIQYEIVVGAGISTTYVTIGNGGGIAYIWLGANDVNQEGTWLWDGDNDNTGTNFWNGQGANGMNNGVAVGGAYNNWGGTSTGTPNEPDNYGSGQHHCAMALSGWPAGSTSLGSAGEWNDIIGTSSIYYIIEYDSASASIENTKEDIDIEIFPNPTTGLLNIKGDNIESVEIIDIAGRIVGTFENPSQTIDISKYEKGVYFAKVKIAGEVFTRKVLLQ